VVGRGPKDSFVRSWWRIRKNYKFGYWVPWRPFGNYPLALELGILGKGIGTF